MPRHLFIDTALANRAYENVSLPIGFKQTISQPYMVARMTELIHETDSMDNVLEIGTGSGYQTSILSMLFKKVTTIERISSLHEKSKKNLLQLGFKNISFVLGDGHLGYLPNSPYDAVIITAAAESIPKNLISQISKKGRIVLPLIDNKNQKLVKLKNTKNGIINKTVEDVFFVPLLPGIEINE
jgi:protein-L-isoaspartate(D-aspartate) O-methyltransferase